LNILWNSYPQQKDLQGSAVPRPGGDQHEETEAFNFDYSFETRTLGLVVLLISDVVISYLVSCCLDYLSKAGL
jgi:hypothetical protein